MKTCTKKILCEKIDEICRRIERIEQHLMSGAVSIKTDEPINVQEASRLVHLSVATIYSKVSRNEIPVNKVGKKLYFYRSELEDWIRSGRIRTALEIRKEVEGKFRSAE
ncbi:helix-turn-helix domain-containing protein [uncultured Flavobacterium sp.]|uniref:helix-turn-helix domain-containing protein n=1 Tax=uncultured Flavobacterium sp. TaxID=165435 RepID=UPI0025D0EC82|nr:helix-turn-helix domain-containing protein [uncultured Flavobacterium sp.]